MISSKPIDKRYSRYLVINLAIQCVALTGAFLVDADRDDQYLLRVSIVVASMLYILIALSVVVRRPQEPRIVDLLTVKWSNIAILAIGVLVFIIDLCIKR
jgi:hypothetical protein